MKISPEQSKAKSPYPVRGKALAALAATAAALFSCDRHVPGSVPYQAGSSDPTDHSAVPETPPVEEPMILGGDVPYVPEPSESSEN
ncbi:MAG: hypothetical protein IJY72_00650 [Akkermansia sp.]|nr:hypothetical protein [Akkermansia sp.]